MTGPIRQGRPYTIGVGTEQYVMVPARVAAYLDAALRPLRVDVRIRSTTAYQVLHEMSLAAIDYRGSTLGTTSAATPEPTPHLGEWLSVLQAAKRIGISDRSVRKAIAEKRLPAQQIAGRKCISRDNADQYRAQRAAA